MDLKRFINDIIDSVVHRRFETIEELCNAIAVQNGVYKVNLVEGSGDIVCDNYLIGTIGIVEDDNGFLKSFDYDFQVYYIKDNLGNYYITESELLEEVS